MSHLDLLRAEIGLHILGQAALPPSQLLDAVHALLPACPRVNEQQGALHMMLVWNIATALYYSRKSSGSESISAGPLLVQYGSLRCQGRLQVELKGGKAVCSNPRQAQRKCMRWQAGRAGPHV